MRKVTIGAAVAVLALGGAALPAGASEHDSPDSNTTSGGNGSRSGSGALGNETTVERRQGQRDEFVAYSDESQEAPRTGVNGWAWSVFRVFDDRIEYSTTIFDLDEDPTAAHLHLAPRGVAGPVIVDLTDDLLSPTRLAGTISPDELGARDMDELLDLIADQQVYLNIHSASHPDGAIRGQLVDSPNFVAGPGGDEVVEHEFTLARVDHDPASDGGSDPTGRVQLRLEGDQLTVRVEVNGLAPGQVHAQHLHGMVGDDGSMTAGSCPTRDADLDGNGLIDTTEGHPSYGDIQVSLTTTGDTSPVSGLAVDRMPTADDDGQVRYERTMTVDPSIAEHLDDLHLVSHGVDVNGDGTYDFGAGPSDLDPTLPQEATLPAACGGPSSATEPMSA